MLHQLVIKIHHMDDGWGIQFKAVGNLMSNKKARNFTLLLLILLHFCSIPTTSSITRFPLFIMLIEWRNEEGLLLSSPLLFFSVLLFWPSHITVKFSLFTGLYKNRTTLTRIFWVPFLSCCCYFVATILQRRYIDRVGYLWCNITILLRFKQCFVFWLIHHSNPNVAYFQSKTYSTPLSSLIRS